MNYAFYFAHAVNSGNGDRRGSRVFTFVSARAGVCGQPALRRASHYSRTAVVIPGLQRIRTQSSAWSLTRYAVPMTPEQARFLLDFTLPTLKQETATTAKVIASTPNAKLDYRPSERCMTAAELMWHIASADVMFLEGILSGTFGKGPEKPDNVKSPEQISAWYKERMSAAIEKLSAYTPEEAARILDLFGFLHVPAAGVVTFAVSHSIHHRGQLSSYIRPMGGKVPSIYGPSADENPFAKAEGR